MNHISCNKESPSQAPFELPHCLFWSDKDNIIQGCNTVAEKIFSITSDTIKGKKFPELSIISNISSEIWHKVARNSLQVTETKKAVTNNETIPLIMPNGRLNQYTLSHWPIVSEDKVIGCHSLLFDCTQLAEKFISEQSLAKAQIFHAIGKAHDQRGIIDNILHQITLLQKKSLSKKFSLEVLNSLKVIQDSAFVLNHYAENIMSTIRDTEKTLVDTISPVMLFESLQLKFCASCKFYNTELRYEKNKSLDIMISGDVKALEHILHGLVSNSIKNTRNGFVECEITEINNGKNLTNPSTWELIIKDTGSGMPDEIIDYLLNPDFEIPHPHSKFGLHMVKQYVYSNLNGKIRCLRNSDTGTTIIITFDAWRA